MAERRYSDLRIPVRSPVAALPFGASLVLAGRQSMMTPEKIGYG